MNTKLLMIFVTLSIFIVSCTETSKEESTFKFVKGSVSKTTKIDLDNPRQLKLLILENLPQILNNDGYIEIKTSISDEQISKRLSAKHGVTIKTTNSTSLKIWLRQSSSKDPYEVYYSDPSDEPGGTSLEMGPLADIIIMNFNQYIKIWNGEDG